MDMPKIVFQGLLLAWLLAASSPAATIAAATWDDGLGQSHLTGANSARSDSRSRGDGHADGAVVSGAGGGGGGDGASHRRSAAAAAGATTAAAAAAAAAGGPVGLLLQLTDIHISAMEGSAGDTKRAPDLLSLSAALLSRWPLAAGLVTGDLTEAKDVYGRCNQDEREWQAYHAAWEALSSVGGVPYGQVYDVRGNHDTFNSGTRCGPRDHYCTYSARAAKGKNATDAAAAAADAVTAAADAAGPRVDAARPPGSVSSAPERGPWGRIFTDAVYARSDAPAASGGAGGRGGGGGGGGGCPVVVVVGVDAALDPGLRSPTNFLGVVTADVLDELDEQLAASLAGMRAAGCSPPYIAYGHYPLSTIAYPGRRRAAAGAATVQQVLVRHGVRAYLAGHLHGAFGRKLHRLHAATPKGPKGANGAAGGRPASELLLRSYPAAAGDDAVMAATAAVMAGAAGRPVGHMMELEMVDWKYGRTVRLLTLDPAAGGVVSFADFRYLPPTSQLPGRRPAAPRQDGPEEEVDSLPPRLEPFEAAAAVGTHLPLITCPPDARYSPQPTTVPYDGAGCGGGGGAAAAATGGGSVTAVVRVMLLPMGAAVPAVPSDPVYLQWSCGDAAAAAEGGDGEREQRESRQPRWRRRRLQRGQNAASSGLAPPSPGGRGSSGLGRSGGGSSRGDGGRLSGVVRMRLEYSTGNYSTFITDLLNDSEAAAGAAAAAEESSAVGGGGGLRSCPAGLIVVQVRVGGDGRSDGLGGGGGSASAQRPLHWHPLPLATAAPLAAATAAAQRQHPSVSVSAALQDAFWAADGGAGAGSVVAAPDSPAPLQQTAVEWLVMHVPWHRFGCLAFVAQWCVLALGMLAAPRAVGVLKARRAQSRDRRRRQQRRRRRWRDECSAHVGDGSGGSSGECDTQQLRGLAGEIATVGQGSAAGSRHLDWEGEGSSTSVCLGGAAAVLSGAGGKSAALKRIGSGSSSGCGGNVSREGHTGDVWTAGLAGSADPVTPRGLHQSPFRRDGGDGGGLRGRGGEPASTCAEGVTVQQGQGNSCGFWRTARGAVRQWLLWPLRDLVELAEDRASAPWLALVLYFTYLAVGPWLAADFVGGDGGGDEHAVSGWGIVTAYGIYMRPLAADARSQWGGPPFGLVAAPSQDHVVILNVVVLVCVAPGLLLCASVAARLRRMAARGKLGGQSGGGTWQVLSWRQATALCGIAVLNLGLCWKLWAGLGWAPVLLSPCVGWLLPLLAAWIWITSSQLAAEARAGRQAAQ